MKRFGLFIIVYAVAFAACQTQQNRTRLAGTDDDSAGGCMPETIDGDWYTKEGTFGKARGHLKIKLLISELDSSAQVKVTRGREETFFAKVLLPSDGLIRPANSQNPAKADEQITLSDASYLIFLENAEKGTNILQPFKSSECWILLNELHAKPEELYSDIVLAFGKGGSKMVLKGFVKNKDVVALSEGILFQKE